MNIDISELIVWLIVGALVGNLVGRLVTFKKEGLGRWTNLGIGMGGALVGGIIFNVFGIAESWNDIKITLQDLVSAFAGALLLLVAWWAFRWFQGRKKN